MTTAICKGCGKEFNIEDGEILYNGEFSCLRCRVKWLRSFESFSAYWLKYKCQSVGGKKLNSNILKETRKDLHDAERKLRSGNNGSGSGGKEKNYRVHPGKAYNSNKSANIPGERLF